VESTYFLYRTTKDPFYLKVGEQILADLLNYTKVDVFAPPFLSNSSVDSPLSGMFYLKNMKTEWRASFSARLSNIYIYCLTKVYLSWSFSNLDNPLHSLDSNFVFTTEGHPIHLSAAYERKAPSNSVAATCQIPPSSTGFFSSVLSIPDAFHPFTPNTSLNTLFLPLLDTQGFSTPRAILEVPPVLWT